MAISISRYSPRWFSGPELKQLAPTGAMLKMSQQDYDINFDRILDQLDSTTVLNDIRKVAEEHGATSVALCCYEVPTDFCHRHVVAKWLNEEQATDIKEFGFSTDAPRVKHLFSDDELTDD